MLYIDLYAKEKISLMFTLKATAFSFWVSLPTSDFKGTYMETEKGTISIPFGYYRYSYEDVEMSGFTFFFFGVRFFRFQG